MAEKQIRVPSGSKLGSNFPPIEVMEIGKPGMPGELIIHNGKLWVYGPNGETYIDGGLIQTDAIQAGSITADKLVIGAQNFSHDLEWTAVDENTISWTEGTLITSNGEEHPINAGSFDETIYQEFFEGPNSPSAAEEDSSFGTQTWSNEDNVFSENDLGASAGAVGSANTHYLKATDFNFNIPLNATIKGILVEIRKATNITSGGAVDARVRLVKNDSIKSGDRADTSTPWPSASTPAGAYAYASHGDDDDLWEEYLTPSHVNSDGFGAAISVAIAYAGGPARQVAIDHIRITVYYTKSAYIYFDGSAELKATSDPEDLVGNDKLLLAIVERGEAGGRVVINPINSSGTTIRGDRIVTGRIESIDGQTYFDLNLGRLVVNDGTDDRILIGKKVV